MRAILPPTVVPVTDLLVGAGDGTQTALRTTAGTSVAVPRPDGPAGLLVGQQVTVHAERGTDGAITAVRVDVPAGP